jgi:Ca2+-binding RTX toxin-like protein
VGSDTYHVDSTGDVIVDDLMDAGVDTVVTSINFSIANRSELEHLTAVNTAATFNELISLTGNAHGNILTGHAGANILNGDSGNDTLTGGGGQDDLNGGTGADSMVGGSGNDTFHIDNAGDTISEAQAGGMNDTVISSITYALNDGTTRFVENLKVEDLAIGVTLKRISGQCRR